MKSATRARWLLEGKECGNCALRDECKKNQAELLVCGKWEKENLLSKLILPIIRRVYPTTIANNIVSVQPMAPQNNTVFNLNYKFGDDDDEEETTMGPMVGQSVEDMLKRQEEYFEKINKKTDSGSNRRGEKFRQQPNVRRRGKRLQQDDQMATE